MARSIGLGGAVVTLVGTVIGVSIYILPGALAAQAGPAVLLSYVLASLLAVFSCTVAAQLGAALPVSGASFVSVSRLVSPLWGFLSVWLNVGGGVVAVALLAFGFADYLQLVWPGVDRTTAAAALVALLGGLNLLGARGTVLGQALMVAVFMVALVTFVAAGSAHVDGALLKPFMPNGLGPVLSAAIPAYFSYAGFTFIIDLGGEIKDPGRSIPRAMAVSFVVVFVVYVSVATVIVGNIAWPQLAGIPAPVGEVAGRVLPGWVATAITLTAVAAAATSVNAILLAYSRDLLAMARVGLLPESLSRISPRHGEPGNGVLLITALCLGAVLVGAHVTDYAVLSVVGLLVLQVLLALAALRLPALMADRYRTSGFRLGLPALRFFAVGLVLCSVAFLAVVVVDSARLLVVAAGYLAVGLGCYAARISVLRRRGQRLQDLVGEEAGRAGRH